MDFYLVLPFFEGVVISLLWLDWVWSDFSVNFNWFFCRLGKIFCWLLTGFKGAICVLYFYCFVLRDSYFISRLTQSTNRKFPESKCNGWVQEMSRNPTRQIGAWHSWRSGDGLEIRDIVWPGHSPVPPEDGPEKFHLKVTLINKL